MKPNVSSTRHSRAAVIAVVAAGVCLLATACGSRANFGPVATVGANGQIVQGADGDAVTSDASGTSAAGGSAAANNDPGASVPAGGPSTGPAGEVATAVGTTASGTGAGASGGATATTGAGATSSTRGTTSSKTGTAPKSTGSTPPKPATTSKTTTTKTAAATAPVGAATLAPVNVGFVIQDSSGAGAILGTSAAFTSDAEQQKLEQLLVDYQNANGGLAGHKINPVFRTILATTTEAERNTDCQSMIQDDHDQAVIDVNIFLADSEWSCFAQGHVNYFGNTTGTDTAFADANAPYVNSTYLGLDHQMAAMVQGAQQVKYFDGGKVGIILPDTPEAHTDYAGILAPALAKAGVMSPDVKYVTLTDGGAQTSQTNSAVLDFSTNGIKNVLFFHDIIVYLAFTQDASTQNYYPRYAYPDFEGAAGVAAYYGTAKANAGSIAVSGVNGYIVAKDPGAPFSATSTVDPNSITPGYKRCLDILTKQSGVNYYDPSQSGDTSQDAYYVCDEFFLYVDAADKVGPNFTAATLGSGLRALGTTYESSLAFGDDFSQHDDGGNAYQVGNYAADCKCFVEATPTTRLAQ